MGPVNAIKSGDGLRKSPEEQIDEYDTSWDTMWQEEGDNDYRARTMVTNWGTAPEMKGVAYG